MATKRVAGLEIPKSASGDLLDFLQGVKERLETHTGDVRAPYERAVTVRDLLDAGIVKAAVKSGYASIKGATSSTGSGSSTADTDLLDNFVGNFLQIAGPQVKPGEMQLLVYDLGSSSYRRADINDVVSAVTGGYDPFEITDAEPTYTIYNVDPDVGTADDSDWQIAFENTGYAMRMLLSDETTKDILSFLRSNGAVTSMTYGNSTDLPDHTIYGDIFHSPTGVAAVTAGIASDAHFTMSVSDNMSLELMGAKASSLAVGLRCIVSGGTLTAPAAIDTTAVNYMGYIGASGYDGTNWQTSSAGLIGIKPNGTWSGTSRPTKITLETTAVGSTSRVARVTIDDTSVTSTLPYYSTAGSATVPGVTSSSDIDTGLYWVGDNTLRVATAGAVAAYFNANGLRVVDGAAATPSYSFINDTDTGIYSSSANVLGFAAGATAVATMSATNLSFPVASYGFDIGSTASTGTPYIDFHSSGASLDYDARIVGFGDISAGTSTGRGILHLHTNHLQVGAGNDATSGSGRTTVLGATATTDAAALTYRTYIAYDAYWDGVNHQWIAVRTTLGRKWMLDMGYHANAYRVRYFDGTVSAPWADSAWSNIITATVSGSAAAQFVTIGDSTATTWTRLFIGANATGASVGLYLDSVAGQNRQILYRSGGSLRWNMEVSSVAESGSNAGSNWALKSYDDTGAVLATPIAVTRSTSGITYAGAQGGPAGSASTPTWSFSGDANTGIYSIGADNLGIALGGVKHVDFASGIYQFGGDAIASANMYLNSAVGIRDFIFRTAGVNRWIIRCDGTAESGADAGSNFTLRNRSDAGADLGAVLTIVRATGIATWANAVTFSAATQHTTIELGNASDTTISRSAAGLLAVEGNIIPHVAYAATWTASHVFQKANITTTSTDGVTLENPTASTAVVTAQWSPRLHFIGHAWKSNATAADQVADWIIENQPVTGAAAITSSLVISSQIAAGGYTARLTLTSGGQLETGDGAVSGPAFSFTNDPDCGMYRIGTNNIGLAVNGAKVIDIATTGATVTGTVTGNSFIPTSSSAPTNGMYLSAANTLAFATNSTLRLSITTAAIISVLPHSNADGSVSAPAYAFTNDLDCGMYRIGTNNIGFATAGVKALDISSAGVLAATLTPLTAASTRVFTGMAAYKSASTSRNTTTTLTADPDLILTFNETGIYIVEAFVAMYMAAAGTGIRFKLQAGTATVSASNGAFVGYVGGGFYANVAPNGLFDQSSGTISTSSSAQDWVHINMTINVSGAGTFGLYWCQSSSSGNNTTVGAYSHIRATKIG